MTFWRDLNKYVLCASTFFFSVCVCVFLKWACDAYAKKGKLLSGFALGCHVFNRLSVCGALHHAFSPHSTLMYVSM